MTLKLVEGIFARSKKLEGTECLIWQGAKVRGAGMLTGGAYVHRVVYIHFHGEVPKGLDVGHKCDRKACVNPDHLEAITRQQNVQDAFRRHLHKKALYNDEDLRLLREGKTDLGDFAKAFSVTVKTAYNIRQRHKVKWR